MKKIILVLFAILTIFLVYKKVSAEEVIIPDTSIRLRVIPNSNSSYDQAMKQVVKNYLEEDVYKLFKDTKNIDEARIIINNRIKKLDCALDGKISLIQTWVTATPPTNVWQLGSASCNILPTLFSPKFLILLCSIRAIVIQSEYDNFVLNFTFAFSINGVFIGPGHNALIFISYPS